MVRGDQLPDGLRRFAAGANGCWIWNGSLNRKGYGLGGGSTAQRAIYQCLFGQLPRNVVLHHLCSNRACVNPDHLQPLTYRDHRNIHLGSQAALEPQYRAPIERTAAPYRSQYYTRRKAPSSIDGRLLPI